MRGNYPSITKGMGKLTPEMWERLMDSLRFYEQKAWQLEIKKPEARQYPLRPPSPVVLLAITDALEVAAGWRWTYGWTEQVLDAGAFVPKEEGRTDLVEGYGRAVNPEEQLNVEGSQSGYGVPASTGLATATPQPLPSGSIVPAVLIRDVTDEVLRPVLMPATNALVVACNQP